LVSLLFEVYNMVYLDFLRPRNTAEKIALLVGGVIFISYTVTSYYSIGELNINNKFEWSCFVANQIIGVLFPFFITGFLTDVWKIDFILSMLVTGLIFYLLFLLMGRFIGRERVVFRTILVVLAYLIVGTFINGMIEVIIAFSFMPVAV
jgi:hypothetical protein